MLFVKYPDPVCPQPRGDDWAEKGLASYISTGYPGQLSKSGDFFPLAVDTPVCVFVLSRDALLGILLERNICVACTEVGSGNRQPTGSSIGPPFLQTELDSAVAVRSSPRVREKPLGPCLMSAETKPGQVS